MGVVLGSAVVPIALAISWHKANKWGSISGAIAGFCAGLIAWLVTTSTRNGGVINVTVGIDFTNVTNCADRLNRPLAATMKCWRVI